MANFRLNDETPVSKITIHLGNTVSLQQSGGGIGNSPIEISSTDASVEIKNKSRSGSNQRFELYGKSPNVSPAKIIATTQSPAADGSVKTVEYSEPLSVRVGVIKNHPGMDVDLLAQLLGRSSDAKKNLMYQMILDPDYNGFGGDAYIYHPYYQQGLNLDGSPKQKTKELSCGDEMKDFAAKYMNGTPLEYFPVHKLRPDLKGQTVERSKIEYETPTLERAVNAIRNLLKQGKPVRVVTIDAPKFAYAENGAIQNQHFVMIVGYGGDQFLYIDPWYGGSNLTYHGGIDGNYMTNFMGVFIYEPGKGIKQDVGICGGTFGGAGRANHFLEVVSGPRY